MDKSLTMEEVYSIYQVFDRDFSSLVLATVTPDGFPHASYSPFVKFEGKYYFIVSESAEHYKNIINSFKASIMFLEDELSTPNVFFRKKLEYKVTLKESESVEVIDKMVEVHGELVEMLVTKMDFHIFEATPSIGQMTIGPGRSYIIKDGEITPNKGNGKGHAKS